MARKHLISDDSISAIAVILWYVTVVLSLGLTTLVLLDMAGLWPSVVSMF